MGSDAKAAFLGRHFVDSQDFSPQEYDALLDLSRAIHDNPAAYAQACRGKLLATLFFEPSTRTRLSFEAAMLRLGGQIITVADPQTSSAAKGESLADTIRTVAGYADIIVMRHPKEGAAKLAALHSPVPIINGGDGAREHPTQTLTDLLTIREHKGRLENLTVAFCGDLRYGRTVHSLIKALACRKHNRFILISPGELRLPETVREEVERLGGEEVRETERMEGVLREVDVLYMTRVQKERFFNEEDYIRLRDFYVLTKDRLREMKEDAIVMHPLPRVSEIAYEVDQDRRAVYFEQARLGVMARMALIASILGAT